MRQRHYIDLVATVAVAGNSMLKLIFNSFDLGTALRKVWP